jgi:hypothetical protein
MNKKYQTQKHIAFVIGKDGTPEFLTSKNPKIWGSYYWHAMFSHASKYPSINPSKQQQMETKNIFLKIGEDLPCVLCKISYKELLIRYPIDEYLSSRKELLTWLYLIRDAVNRKLIVQERKEVERYLKHFSKDEKEEKRVQIEKRVLYTKPSPSLCVVLKRWIGLSIN